MDLGKFIATARKKRGLTQAELAKLTKTKPTYLSHIESGRRSPSIHLWDAICEALEISPDNIPENLKIPSPHKTTEKKFFGVCLNPSCKGRTFERGIPKHATGLTPDSKYCRFCGSELIFKHHCGAEISLDTSFCSGCGERIFNPDLIEKEKKDSQKIASKDVDHEEIYLRRKNISELIGIIPTGILPLDIALGIGGLPRGRIVEFYGPDVFGKTMLALHVIAEVQKKGGTAAFIDAEHALDPLYAKKIGVNIDELLISQPDSGEQALEITEKLVGSGAVDIVVIDSVAALVPRAEIEGEMGDSHMGLQARLMSQALRKLTSVVANTRTTVVFINQIRHKIDIMFGSPETTPGGVVKFYSSVRLDIRKIETLKKGDIIVGARIRVKIVKNKFAPPYREAEFEMINGEGISSEGCLLDMGVETGHIEKEVGYLYFVDKNGDAARVKIARWRKKGSKSKKASKCNIEEEDGYPYFIDKKGNMSRAEMVKPKKKKNEKNRK